MGAEATASETALWRIALASELASIVDYIDRKIKAFEMAERDRGGA